MPLRIAGNGTDPKFRITGAIIATCSCMIGNYLSVIGLIAHYNSVSFLKAFLFSNGGTIMSEMFKNAGIMDFIF